MSRLGQCAVLSALILSGSACSAEFTLNRILEQPRRDPPAVCLLMSEPAALQDLNAYIELNTHGKKQSVNSSVIDGRICLTNLKFGTDYALTLKAGIKSTSGSRLKQDLNTVFDVSDAPAQLTFDPGLLMPRDRDLLNIYALNQPDFEFSLYKLNLKDLNALDLYSLLNEKLEPYQLSNLLQTHAREIYRVSKKLPGIKNQRQKISFKIKDLIERDESGLYLAIISDPKLKLNAKNAEGFYDLYNRSAAWNAKLIMLSDLGLSIFQGQERMAVSVHALSTAMPVPKVKLSLLAADNEVLAHTYSDNQGNAVFDVNLKDLTNAQRPIAVIAAADQDAMVQDLRTKPLFFENADGVKRPDPLSLSYAFTLRPWYRPGEQVEYTALLRRNDLSAFSAASPALTLYAPNGTLLSRVRLSDQGFGSYKFNYTLPLTASRGIYTLKLSRDGISDTALTNFNVSDFMPAAVSLSAQDQGKDLPSALKLQAQYNYGAPAADLNILSALTLTPDPHPIPRYHDWHFGPDQQDYAQYTKYIDLNPVLTDKQGYADLKIPALPPRPFAQSAGLESKVYDPSGVAQKLTGQYRVPAADGTQLIGIKQNDRDSFSLVICDQAGRDSDQDISYRIVREIPYYQYVYADERWQFRRQVIKRPVSSGLLKSSQDQARLIQAPAEAGEYLLTAFTGQGQSQLRFVQGYASGNAQQPDLLQIFSDKAEYLPGAEVKLSFDAPAAGSAVLTLGSRNPQPLKSFKVHKGRNTVSFKLKDQNLPGVHALINVYLPEAGPGPERMAGLILIKQKPADLRLKPKLEAPDEIKPGSELKLKVTADEDALLLLSAADAGLPGMQKNFTDPISSLLRPQAYALHLYDAYGLIMQSLTHQDQGYGDEATAATAALSVLPRKIIAMSSGLVRTKNRQAEIRLQIPDFTGALKLRLWAWNDRKLGFTEHQLIVRDQLVLEPRLPRFMAPGDELDSALDLKSLSFKGKLKVNAICLGALACSLQDEIEIQEHQQLSLPLKIHANNAGSGRLRLSAAGRDFTFKHDYDLSLRSAWPDSLFTQIQYLKPGAVSEFKLPMQLAPDFKVNATLSTLPVLSKTAIAEILNQDYFADAADLSALLKSRLLLKENRQQVQDLIDQLCAMTGPDGSVVSFDPDASETAVINAYDALTAAHASSYMVPETILEALQQKTQDLSRRAFSTDAQAHALAALALNSMIDRAQMRYLLDSQKDLSLSAYAYLSQALASASDHERAKIAFKEAIEAFNQAQSLQLQLVKDPYQQALSQASAQKLGLNTDLNTGALLILKAMRYGNFQNDLNQAAQQAITPYIGLKYPSASQLALMLDAAQGMPEAETILSTDMAPYRITNTAKEPRFAIFSVSGLPLSAPPAQSHNLSLSFSPLSIKGQTLPQPLQLHAGSSIIAAYAVMPRILLSDKLKFELLLPSGTEAELIMPGDPRYPWLKDVNYAMHHEQNDDRLQAWYYAEAGKTLKIYVRLNFNLPGKILMPGALVYALHQNQTRAELKTQSLEIKP